MIVKHGGACVKVHEVSLKKKPLEGGTDSINPKVSNTDDCAITDSSQGLETSGASPSVKNKSNEPRVWEETGGASSSARNCNDSSICNPSEYSMDSSQSLEETSGASSSVKKKIMNLESGRRQAVPAPLLKIVMILVSVTLMSIA